MCSSSYEKVSHDDTQTSLKTAKKEEKKIYSVFPLFLCYKILLRKPIEFHHKREEN